MFLMGGGENEKMIIENITQKLNRSITIGEENWELLICSLMSAYAPKIPINGLEKRSSIHTIFCGDISSAKTSALHLLAEISPKYVWIDDSTKASFVGIATKNGIQPGIIDMCKSGAMFIPEYAKVKIPYLRQFLDNDTITISKWGFVKAIKPKTVMMVAINPKGDWFLNSKNLRLQINQSEGDLSRFDIMLPTIVNTSLNEKIIDKMSFFSSDKNFDLGGIKSELRNIKWIMDKIKRVVLAEKQKNRLRDTFKLHNKNLRGKRPVLLIPRDFETLLRLVNTVVCLNVSRRENKNERGGLTVRAEDVDIDKSITLWESIINKREIIYTSANRNLINSDLKERLYEIISGRDKWKVSELERTIEEYKIMSRATFYRKLKELISEDRLKKIGNKPMYVEV